MRRDCHETGKETAEAGFLPGFRHGVDAGAVAWVYDASVRQVEPVEVWFRWGFAVATGGLAVRQWYHWLRCRKQHQMDDPGAAEAPAVKPD